MKIVYLLMLCSICLIFSCTNNHQNLKTEPKVKLLDESFPFDSIPEKNSPEYLDLSQQQLFIDTSRNSEFYKELSDWNSSEYTAESFNFGNTKLSKIKLNKFPKVWIEIRKYKDEFILFNPCDGNIPHFEIRDSLIFTLDTHDADFMGIVSKVKESNSELNLKTIDFNKKVSNFVIKKTKFNDIYSIKYNSFGNEGQALIVPLDKISNFNMMVNHSPKEKVIEFEACCDTIDFSKF